MGSLGTKYLSIIAKLRRWWSYAKVSIEGEKEGGEGVRGERE